MKAMFYVSCCTKVVLIFMNKIKIEACCMSATDVFAAKRAGADRCELNSGLFFGGLTPSIGELISCVDAGIPIITMIRPRPGGFVYSNIEKKAMLHDVRELTKAGASGIVFGCLNDNGSIDIEFTKHMINAANGAECVFHRAFDLIKYNWREALDVLCDLGVTRILTSGHRSTLALGAERIREIIDYAAGRIEILVCGGIRANNVNDLIAATGCTQIHTSGGMRTHLDKSVLLNDEIRFTESIPPMQGEYRMLDEISLTNIVKAVNCKDV